MVFTKFKWFAMSEKEKELLDLIAKLIVEIVLHNKKIIT
jgi:hypothetical protein